MIVDLGAANPKLSISVKFNGAERAGQTFEGGAGARGTGTGTWPVVCPYSRYMNSWPTLLAIFDSSLGRKETSGVAGA
jgi:hypothetical protein